MGLRGVFTAALPGIFAAAGEDAVFTPAAGDAVACKIFIDFNVLLQPAGVEAQTWERGTTIEVLLSVLGREPDRGEIFTYDSIDYAVRAILENDGLTVKMTVT